MKSKKLNVMQLVLSLVIGGTERLVFRIVRESEDRNINSIVCCLDEIGDFGELLRDAGRKVYLLERRPGIDWHVMEKLRDIIHKEKIDVIHAHQYTPFFYGLMGALRYRGFKRTAAPGVVFTEHGIDYPYHKKIKRMLLNPFLCRIPDEVITISHFTKSLLTTYENYPPNKIRVVYNGIDLKLFDRDIDVISKKEETGIPPESPVVGIVARLDPVKNHAMLIRAFKSVLKEIPDAHLIIVGGGHEESALREIADTPEPSGNIRFLGPRQDVSELLKIMDVFVLPSFSEGMSVTLLEAMAAGVPIIATRVGGNPEVVTDGKTGILIPTDDTDAMVKNLLLLLKNRDIGEKMGNNGFNDAISRFSLKNMMDAYTELYFRIAENRR